MSALPKNFSRERGSGLIIIIIIVAFMLAVGTLLITVTGTSPKISGNIRLQTMAFDAAEAGFNSAWAGINDGFINKEYESFANLYRTTFGGADGLDDPLSPVYYRKLTDEQIWADVQADPANVLFAAETLAADPRCSFTVFLVRDEAPGTLSADDGDCIMICIGRGPRNTYKRLEIVIQVELAGS